MHFAGIGEGIDLGSGDGQATGSSHDNEAATNDRNEKHSKSQVGDVMALAGAALYCCNWWGIWNKSLAINYLL